MLKNIQVKNFRSLDNFSMKFNDGLNVIIGENDAGKTTLIDSMKLLFGEITIDKSDFTDEEKEVIIELETNDSFYRMKVKSDDLKPVFESKPSKEKCDLIFDEINSKEFLEIEESQQREILKKHCNTFGITYRTNSKIETIITNINTKIDDITKNNKFIEQKQLNYPISFLGSKDFENMNLFFENTFFKELKQEIWNHKIGDKTINYYLDSEINKFKEEVLSENNTEELYQTLSEFLPQFKEIELDIQQESKIDLKINVNLLNSKGQEISLEKMGDGTNRRTTMAVFKHKQDKNDLCYIFDEPDTHLHIKAQLDILRLFKELTSNNKQVIITTHSPYLINEVNPNDIKLLFLDSNNKSNIKILTEETESKFLKDLGISNIDLFFTNKLVIVEGESEELFLPAFYEKIFGYPISHKFIKIVKAEGIKDISNFIRVIKDTFPSTNIFILMDNDASPREENKLDKIIRKYKDLSEENIFKIGTVEFEDSFTDEVLTKSINDYLKEINCKDKKIKLDDVKKMKAEKNKISKEIENFLYTLGIARLEKPRLAKFLAQNANKEDVDENILKLFKLL